MADQHEEPPMEGRGMPTAGPSRQTAASAVAEKPKSMSRPKYWSDEVEEAYRFQLAGYRDEREYKSIKKTDAERWPHNGYIKKLERQDGSFYYFNRSRECSDKDIPKCKIYAY